MQSIRSYSRSVPVQTRRHGLKLLVGECRAATFEILHMPLPFASELKRMPLRAIARRGLWWILTLPLRLLLPAVVLGMAGLELLVLVYVLWRFGDQDPAMDRLWENVSSNASGTLFRPEPERYAKDGGEERS